MYITTVKVFFLSKVRESKCAKKEMKNMAFTWSTLDPYQVNVGYIAQDTISTVPFIGYIACGLFHSQDDYFILS